MHPMEVATSSTEHSSGPGPVVTSASMSSLSRYGSEPDPFKHATDVSQCVTCGAQITVIIFPIIHNNFHHFFEG